MQLQGLWNFIHEMSKNLLQFNIDTKVYFLFLVSVFIKYESISLEKKKKLRALIRDYRGVLISLKQELDSYFKNCYRSTIGSHSQ